MTDVRGLDDGGVVILPCYIAIIKIAFVKKSNYTNNSTLLFDIYIKLN